MDFFVDALWLLASFVALSLVGYGTRENIRFFKYGLCVYSICIANVLFFAYWLFYLLGYITLSGKTVGIPGEIFVWTIKHLFETEFVQKIFIYSFLFVALNGLVLFVIAGLADCLPRNSKTSSENEFISRSSRKIIKYTGILYSKSLASLGAFFPSTAIFLFMNNVTWPKEAISFTKSFSLFLFCLSAAIFVIRVIDVYIASLGDRDIYFSDERFQQITRFRYYGRALHRLLRWALSA